MKFIDAELVRRELRNARLDNFTISVSGKCFVGEGPPFVSTVQQIRVKGRYSRNVDVPIYRGLTGLNVSIAKTFQRSPVRCENRGILHKITDFTCKVKHQEKNPKRFKTIWKCNFYTM